ncbi:MAG: glycoside hydrolase family 31 protein [Telluria sp.]
MKVALRTMLALAIAFGSSAASAQPVRPVGQVRAVEVAGQQVRMQTEGAHVELTVYSPSVIRVRIDKQKPGRDFSYAVVARPLAAKTTVSEDDKEVVIATSALKARVAKRPFSITFTTLDGKVINQDEPGLGTSWVGDEVATYKKLQDGERFIGLGEKAGNLDRRGSAYTNWNTDAFKYGAETDPLYASVPFYIGIHHGLNYGVFFDNSYQSDFNFGASNNRFSSFSAQGGEMNYYFIYHPRVADIIGSYTALTGRMPLPPLWSLGYQQNRYSYFPDTEVLRIAQTLREKKIPADGITLDIHYMDAYKLFTWDKARFPDPAGMIAKLADMGFKTTVIVDPGIKVEKGYGAYERGLKENIFLKYPDGSDYTGEVWPGWCHFPDFTSENGRAWWRSEVRAYAKAGVAGLWNDMNEISTWGQKMPNNVLFGFDGQPTTHKQGHNVYALEMTRASYEGMKEATGQRPFMLTRAGFAGLQRYTAIWTGDNRAEEDHMLLGVRLMNSLGLSGIPFTGMDVGGFIGSATKPLYARWMQIGAFTPYFRNHAANDTRSSEPWTYGEDVETIARNYIGLRYRLMPYLYSAFHDATTTGEPVMRSLAIDYTHDPKVYAREFQNQYMFGKAFLVAPFESTKDFAKVYLPAGKWYDLHSDALHMGGKEHIAELSASKLPVFVKESSIVPVQSLVQSTSEKPDGTLALHIYKGDADNLHVYYEDDGASFAYQKGAFYKRTISYHAAARRIEIGAAEGSFTSKFSKLQLVLHGFGPSPKLDINGTGAALDTGAYGFAGMDGGQVRASSVIIDNGSGKIVIGY